ncbi:putative transposase [Mycobacterium xenopi 3993]|nr:putative transposase [Mycobacterium xenopi 3993]
MTFTRKSDQIAAEAALDGIYVLRTSLPDHSLGRDDVVGRYKDLADVERFFRTLNSELDVRPIRHRLADRVRAHLFLRMLSYYISWHMKQALAPILFADNDKPAAAAKRADPVAPPNAPIKPSPRPPANAPKTTTRCTASPACSPTWPPSAPTRFNPPTTCRHSPKSPTPPHCNGEPSNCSTSPTATA